MGGTPSTSAGVTSVFYQEFRKKDDNDNNILSLVREVQARTDLSHETRPPILASFLDIDPNNNEAGIIVITSHRIENFSRQYGFRKWQRSYHQAHPPIVTCHCLPQNASSTSLVMAIGFRNGKVEIIDSRNLQLRRCLITPIVPSLSLTQLRTPIDNVISCGYDDASVRLFFINSGEIGATIDWPSEYLRVADPLSSLAAPAGETCVSAAAPIEFDRRPCKVTALGFCREQNWLLVGYEGYKQLTNQTHDGQTTLVDLSPPITLYNVESKNLVSTFEPTNGSVIFTTVTKLPSSSVSRPSPLVLIAVTPTSFIVWQLPESLSLEQQSLHSGSSWRTVRVCRVSLSVSFSNTPISQFNLGRCVSAAMDSSDSVLFLLFEFGFIASIALSITPISSATTHQPTESKFRVDYSFYRLMKVGSLSSLLPFFTCCPSAEFPYCNNCFCGLSFLIDWRQQHDIYRSRHRSW